MALSTLKELAEKAGVSKSTVSRVINRSPRVAPDVAQNVLETMQRLGFEPAVRRPGPKLGARRGNRTRSILLMVMGTRLSNSHQSSGYPTLLRGVEDAMAKENLKLVLAGSLKDEPLPLSLTSGDVDGVLLCGREEAINARTIDSLRKLPTVGLLREFAALGASIDRVNYNNRQVGPMAASHLIRRGHKHLALFNTDATHPAFTVRAREFAATAQKENATVKILQSDRRPETLREHHETYRALVAELIASTPRPTGLFVTADYQLPLLYETLRQAGITPNSEFEVISCDAASEFLDMVSPRPASIDINLELVGAEGVRQLLWRLERPDTVNRVTITIEPKLRHSL